MKKIYNNLIDWIISVIAVVVYIPIFVMKLITEILGCVNITIVFINKRAFVGISKVLEVLLERLSVKD